MNNKNGEAISFLSCHKPKKPSVGDDACIVPMGCAQYSIAKYGILPMLYLKPVAQRQRSRQGPLAVWPGDHTL